MREKKLELEIESDSERKRKEAELKARREETVKIFPLLTISSYCSDVMILTVLTKSDQGII